MGRRSLSDPDYVEFIATLRRVRLAKGVTQKALSERIGKPQSFVAKVENRERRLDLLEVLKLCRALSVRLSDIAPAGWRKTL